MEYWNANEIIIAGSLNPNKTVQDRVRVLSAGGSAKHYEQQITKIRPRLSLTQPIGILNPNGYERVNRVYSEEGYSPCITGRDYKDPIKVLIYE